MVDVNHILSVVLNFWTALLVVVVVALKSSVKFVPQNMGYVIERFGKYQQTLYAGLGFIVPFIDRVAYQRTLKEQTINVPSQSAITKDNITLVIDGILYLKVLDAEKASYGVEDYMLAMTQLAQTSMRSEIGKMELDRTFEERESLNTNIVNSINEAAAPWGVQAMRYEIRDIDPPKSVLDAMERQMKAEREKRALILESEGQRQAAINTAEGEKQAQVLAAEADRQQQILRAQGEAQAILAVAEARAQALRQVGEAAATTEGQKAIQFDLATNAIDAKKAIAKESTLVLLPDGGSDAGSVVAQAMSIVNSINTQQAGGTGAKAG